MIKDKPKISYLRWKIGSQAIAANDGTAMSIIATVAPTALVVNFGIVIVTFLKYTNQMDWFFRLKPAFDKHVFKIKYFCYFYLEKNGLNMTYGVHFCCCIFAVFRRHDNPKSRPIDTWKYI